MPKVSKEPKTSYRQLKKELDAVLAWFDDGDVDLDEALVKYEQAIKLLDQMESYLKTAKNKVMKIAKTL